jgi:hypothetical protein
VRLAKERAQHDAVPHDAPVTVHASSEHPSHVPTFARLGRPIVAHRFPPAVGGQSPMAITTRSGASVPRADLKRRGTTGERARTSEGAVGHLAGLRCRCYGCAKLREISGANVTVSRTHTGFSLCVQIIRIFNRFEVKQGGSLFSDTCEKQRRSCPPEFEITEMECPWAVARQRQWESDVGGSGGPSRAKVGMFDWYSDSPGGRMT